MDKKYNKFDVERNTSYFHKNSANVYQKLYSKYLYEKNSEIIHGS